MKQKISAPVAIAIVVVVAVVVFAGLYRQFLYQPTYSASDIAAKFKGGGKGQAPPNMQRPAGQ